MATTELVAAPARQTRQGGIRSVATFVTTTRLGATEAVSFLSDGCTFPQPAIGLCYGEVVEDDKTSTGIDTIDAISEPFALYAGVECGIVEGSSADYAERARNLLEGGVDRVLEERLATWAAGGTALTAGSSLTDALAIVDNALDDDYPGQGVILMNRGDAVRASAEGSLDWSLDGTPTTVNGTPVIASSRVDAGAVLGVGAITVLHTNVETFPGVDFRTNRDWQVAESVYAIIVDCELRVVSAVEVEGV